MFEYLSHIYDPRERLLVGLADIGLSALAWPTRVFASRRPLQQPRRILLFRLERIGDLLMTLSALQAVKRTWPDAHVDLVVGSWNRDLASHLPWVDDVLVIDAPWLSRGPHQAWLRDVGRMVARWRRTDYALAMNLEGDIRSNLLLALSGARVRVGFPMAGGGSLLTHAVSHEPTRHTADNALALVRVAAQTFERTVPDDVDVYPTVPIPADVVEGAGLILRNAGWDGRSKLIGIHPSGGRAIKQWHGDRFGRVAGALAHTVGATIVFTGTAEEADAVRAAMAAVPDGVAVIDVGGKLDVLQLAAVLKSLTLYVTGDTGPMHLAAAMDTPVVALFGVSDPRRYAPRGRRTRVVRIDLPCSPCNRVRLPPVRCQGHVPDCLEGIHEDLVVATALELLRAHGDPMATRPGSSGSA
ncbi:MAG: glycosyltransferase family 9 protein [Vicinamibacterales bacterium]